MEVKKEINIKIKRFNINKKRKMSGKESEKETVEQ